MTFLLISRSLLAHDPDQISYQFKRSQDSAQLHIHLTPKSILDLVKSLRSELNDTSVVRLSDYYTDLAQYFNESIVLKVDNKPIRFVLYEADLIHHDAYLGFKLVGFGGSFEGFELSINSFTELYKRTENHVSISIDQEELSFTLNSSVTRYSHKTDGSTKLWLSGFHRLYIISISFIVLAMILTVVFLPRIKKRLSSKDSLHYTSTCK